MTHIRSRIAEPTLVKALSYSPCVGILGMRQVGKTTILKKFSNTFFTFDEPAFDLHFQKLGLSLIEKAKPPVALDEIQKHPAAFDTVKYSVDRTKKMGKFLLSGSVRFASRRQIRESLTGRIVLIEVFPLSLSECHSVSPNPFLTLTKSASDDELIQKLKKRAWAKMSHLTHYLQTGGLPGICFRREEKVRRELFEVHLDTLLGRDIHLIRQTNLSLATLRNFILEIARNQGGLLPIAQLARTTGISRLSATRLLDALEGLFLIRRYGDWYFIEDAGLASHLNPFTGSLSLMDRIRATYYELRIQHSFGIRNEATLKPYSTRGGIDLPFLMEFKSGERVAIAISCDDVPTDKNLKTFSWLKKRLPGVRPIVLCNSDQAFISSSGVVCLPWLWIF